MRIHWLLCGNERVPSARIHGINLHRKLVQEGYDSVIIHQPYRFLDDLYFTDLMITLIARLIKPSDTVVVQKLRGPKTLKMVRYLKKKGVRIVFIDCDLPLKTEMAKLADIVICPSTLMCEKYQQEGITPVYHIDDAWEVSLAPYFHTKEERTVVWYGKSGQGKWKSVIWFNEKVLPFLSSRWRLITISDHPDATFAWAGTASWEVVNQADLTIIPVPDTEQDAVKSANRCTQSFALGVPVLCSPLRSYREVIKDHDNGLITDYPQQWIDFITSLEDDQVLNKLKHRAQASSVLYSPEAIVKKWVGVLSLEKSKRPSMRSRLLGFIRELHIVYYSIRLGVHRLSGI